MPEKLKGPFSFTIAKSLLTASDMERLACAFLATENVYQLDLNKVASEFGGAKPDSFKRSIWVITKKIKEAMEGQGSKLGGGGGDEVVATPSKSAGKKRKGGASEFNGDESTAKKKAKVRAKPKKARTEMEQGDGEEDEDPLVGVGETPVKKEKHAVGEGDDDDDADEWLA
ncbi:hypothetical protein BST61_g3519 [Cercospora zeina]